MNNESIEITLKSKISPNFMEFENKFGQKIEFDFNYPLNGLNNESVVRISVMEGIKDQDKITYGTCIFFSKSDFGNILDKLNITKNV